MFDGNYKAVMNTKIRFHVNKRSKPWKQGTVIRTIMLK